jgi:hypothetical protein
MGVLACLDVEYLFENMLLRILVSDCGILRAPTSIGLTGHLCLGLLCQDRYSNC